MTNADDIEKAFADYLPDNVVRRQAKDTYKTHQPRDPPDSQDRLADAMLVCSWFDFEQASQGIFNRHPKETAWTPYTLACAMQVWASERKGSQ